MLNLIETPFQNLNPYSHTGLSLDEIQELRRIIENDKALPYLYFVTMTWRPKTQWDFVNGREYEAQRKEDWRRYIQKLAWETNNHIKSYGAISLPHMNIHAHSILCCQKPITPSMGKHLWKHGDPVGKDWKPYNPRWAEDNGIEDLSRGALKYVHNKHHEHERLYFGDVFCAAKRSCCRKGRCPYRHETYRIGGSSKTKDQAH